MHRHFLHVFFQRFQAQHHGCAEHKPEDMKIRERHDVLRYLQRRLADNDRIEETSIMPSTA